MEVPEVECHHNDSGDRNIEVGAHRSQRELHIRNKKAMDFIAKGWSALKEVDRIIDYCELNDRRLIPLLRLCSGKHVLALGVQVPEVLLKLSATRGAAARKSRVSDNGLRMDPVEMASKQFEIAAKAGCDLGLWWLTRLEEEEKLPVAT